MIPTDQEEGTSPSPSPNGLGGPGDVEATTSFSRSAGPLPAGATPGNLSADARRFDFLRPPRAEGELGWLAHYRVKSLIGEGGIGLVFLAEDTHLARLVALKVIKPELANAPDVRGRFVREAQATAAIKHDHIVTIYQVGRDGDILFLAMEYLQGLSLQGWLERGRKPSMDLVLRIGREIASGLAAAHRVGLIHRDIKPANIWLEAPSGRIKILDFGMARSERNDAQITHAGTVMGTPAYMAPEQARGETAGAGSDLFSLGCVLYRLCAGRLPFEGATILAVLSALASDTPRSLREVDPAVGPALDELVSRMLAKDPSARPASAQAVVDSLRAIERGLLADRQKLRPSDDSNRPTAAPDDPQGPRPGPRDGRRAWRVAAVAAATVALAVGVLAIARPRRGPQVIATRRNIATPPHAAPVAPPLGGKTDSAPRPIDHDRPIPEVTRAPMRRLESSAPAGVPAPPAPMPPAEGRPEVLEPPRVAKPGEDRAATTATSPGNWGPPIDPDGDCRFEVGRDGDEIKIAIPGSPHILSAELGRQNAPRLLRPVRGDFDVTVNVDGVFHPTGRPTTKEYAPYHGAGILLWQDDRNYVRLEIAADVHRGKVRNYANFELRKGGALAVSKGQEFKDGSTRLRLERRGSEVRAAFGPDGVRWTEFAPLTLEFADRLSVGVVAINSSSKPLNAELAMFAITPRNPAGDDGPRGNDKPPRPEARPSP